MPGIDDPSVLIDAATQDDAAVYKLDNERALVATVDFFTPIVDDPYTFGAIAAANALSDVYAMGARPLFALNLVAWPREDEMLDLLTDTIRGGADKVGEAGAFIVGGHTIDDKEPKYGLVVLGEVHPDKILTCGNPRPGDVIILTKPLGTGVLSTALKNEIISEQEMSSAIESMCTLNAGAAAAVETVRDSVSGVTDVTGFGLLGHLHNLLGDAAGAQIDVSKLPIFPGVSDLIEQGAVPGGTEKNREAIAEHVRWGAEVTETQQIMACDAQTSGGLLIALRSDKADALIAALRKEGAPAPSVIGHITQGDSTIEVISG